MVGKLPTHPGIYTTYTPWVHHTQLMYHQVHRHPDAQCGPTTPWAQEGNNPWVEGLRASQSPKSVKVGREVCAGLLRSSWENKVKIG